MAVRQEQGLLLIPDISGYTEFLSEVELAHGEHIICGLLKALIASNALGLQLSEVEGDALLYFRLGEPPPGERILEQVRTWFTSFHEQLNLYRRDIFCECGSCQNLGNLSLKVVGHFGEIGLYQIEKTTKLIGKDVVLIHRMLKNSLPLGEYFLVTPALVERMEAGRATFSDLQRHREEYPIFGPLELGYLDLSPLRTTLLPVPAREPLPALDGEIRAETLIQTSLDRVAEVLTDLDQLPLWMEDVKRVEMDRSAPLHAGHEHVCVTGKLVLHQVVDRVVRDRQEFTMVMRVRPPSFLIRKLMVIRHARQEPDGVWFTESLAFERAPVVGWVFDWLAKPELQRMHGRNVQRLKALLEGAQEPQRPVRPAV